MCWFSCWGWLLFIPLFTLVHGFGLRDFRILLPKEYVALSGELPVRVQHDSSLRTIHPGFLINASALEAYRNLSLVLRQDAEDAPLALQQVAWSGFANVSAQIWEARVNFSCGDVPHGGRFTAQLLFGQEVLAESQPLDVRWPVLRMEVPWTVETYRTPFTVRMYLSQVVCYPLRTHFLAWAELVHCAWNSPCVIENENQIHARVEMTQFMKADPLEATFPCTNISHSGHYRVFLRANTSQSAREVVAVSNAIQVTLSELFDVHVRAKTVIPCTKDLVVVYQHPPCIGEQDKVRVFGRLPNNVSAGFPVSRMDYLFEKRVVPGRRALSFPCPGFNADYEYFCFRYVNTAPNGAVSDVAEACLPAFNHSEFREGRWSSWSNWSSCSGICNQGFRHRYRICDNPLPSNAGPYCRGSPLQMETCPLNPCPVPTTTLSPLDVPLEHTSQDPCQCDCQWSLEFNQTLTWVISTVRCPHGGVKIVRVPENLVVLVEVEYLRLDCDYDPVLVIRDGFSSVSTVVAYLDQNTPIRLLSSTAAIHLQLMATLPANNSFCIAGVILHVSASNITASPATTQLSFMEAYGTPKPSSPTKLATYAIFLVLLCLLTGIALLVAVYSRLGLRCRHGVQLLSTRSSTSSNSDYQLMSSTSVTSVSAIDEDPSHDEKLATRRRRHLAALKKRLKSLEEDEESLTKCKQLPEEEETESSELTTTHNTSTQEKSETLARKPQGSLPNSPFAARRRFPLTNPLMRRSLRNIPEHKILNIPLANKSSCSSYPSLKMGPSSSDSGGIELQPIKSQAAKSQEAEARWEEMHSPSDNVSSKTLSECGTDLEMELDYYDLNVDNARAAPGSLFHADPLLLAWTSALSTKALSESHDPSTAATTPTQMDDIQFADDEITE